MKNLCSLCKQKEKAKGQHSYCRECANLKNRESAKKHPETQINKKLKERYGITLDQYNELSKKQDNLCAICKDYNVCKVTDKLYVDHDHDTSKIRGLLCQKCNTGLGNFKDNILILESAVRYLKGDN